MVKGLAIHGVDSEHAAIAAALSAALLWVVAWTRARELRLVAPAWVLVGSAIVGGALAVVAPTSVRLAMAVAGAALFVNAATDVRLGRIVNWAVVVGIFLVVVAAGAGGTPWRAIEGGAITFGCLTVLNLTCRVRLWPWGDVKAAIFLGMMLGAFPGIAASAIALAGVAGLTLIRRMKAKTPSPAPISPYPLAPFYLGAAVLVLAIEQSLGTGIG